MVQRRFGFKSNKEAKRLIFRPLLKLKGFFFRESVSRMEGILPNRQISIHEKYYRTNHFCYRCCHLTPNTYFKFTGAPESVFIFSQLGLEPYGRVGLGVVVESQNNVTLVL